MSKTYKDNKYAKDKANDRRKSIKEDTTEDEHLDHKFGNKDARKKR